MKMAVLELSTPRRSDIKMADSALDPAISERKRALLLAAKILDRPNADPDDDLALLARQLSRACDEMHQLEKAVIRFFMRTSDG